MKHRLIRTAAAVTVGISALTAHSTFAIAGGSNTSVNEYPWQIGLWINDWGFLLGY